MLKKTSLKTTALGFMAALVAWLTAGQAYLDTDPATLPQWGLALSLTIAAVGLLFARDNNVTSEAAGAK